MDVAEKNKKADARFSHPRNKKAEPVPRKNSVLKRLREIAQRRLQPEAHEEPEREENELDRSIKAVIEGPEYVDPSGHAQAIRKSLAEPHTTTREQAMRQRDAYAKLK